MEALAYAEVRSGLPKKTGLGRKSWPAMKKARPTKRVPNIPASARLVLRHFLTFWPHALYESARPFWG